MIPQIATPPSIIDHSEGVSPNSLPSLITYVIIGWYLVLTRRTLAIAGGKGCSARVTDRLNLARRCRRSGGSSARAVVRSWRTAADQYFATLLLLRKIAQATGTGATQIKLKHNDVRENSDVSADKDDCRAGTRRQPVAHDGI